MSHTTPIYNLIKIDPTDPIGSFIAWYNSNLDTIDANLGGGGGGGTHIYSTTEQEVGEWIDGRTIYERSYDLGADLSCASGVWTNTLINKGDKLHFINAQLHASDGTWCVANVGVVNTVYIGIYNPDSSPINVRYITLQYTKDALPPIHLIEYIESTGTQFIRTGITPTVDSSFEIVLSNVMSSGEGAIIGAGAYSSNNYLMTQDAVGGSPLVWYYPYKQIITYDYTSKHTIELYRGSITLDGTVVTSGTSIGQTSFGEITLFNVANSHYCNYKLYSFRIYESGNLVFEGLPAKDNNNVVCLFDTVSLTYIYNSGTGDFIGGNDI